MVLLNTLKLWLLAVTLLTMVRISKTEKEPEPETVQAYDKTPGTCYDDSCSVTKSQSGRPKKVAIIGSGIGGSTSAFFLREKLGSKVDITVFEASDHIGGRLRTVQIGDREYEAGGSVIHPKNFYMKNLTEFFHLNFKNEGPRFTFGLYDGQNIVFQSSRIPYWTEIKMAIRYGLDLIRLNPWIDGILKWYAKIYDAQLSGKAFATVHSMFHSLSPLFDDLMTSSIGDYLKQLGFSTLFIKELARIAMRTNYGQDVDIQGFVGAVSLAGTQGDLWSVEGGNYRVAEEAIKAAKVQWVKAKVTEITSDNMQYKVSWGDQVKKPINIEVFDAVILAVPCTDIGCSGITLNVIGIEKKLETFPKSYHRTVANFVKGYVNPEFFGVTDPKDFPDALYSISDHELIFNSMARLVPVDYGTRPNEKTNPNDFIVWKIFSNKPLNVHHVRRLFVSHEEFQAVDWLAYPNYGVPGNAKESLPSFIMDSQGGLISINAIETSASAMEQSVIGAKNAAFLVAKYLHG